MTVIDTLQIMVEADSHGIEQTLKKVTQTVTGTVNSINSQEIDWTSIFSRAVTPAIISSVASMFAFAIEQSLQFNQALNTTGTAAGDSTSQIAQLGEGALAASTIVPASAQSIAQAMAALSAVFGDTTDQQSVATEMAQLSAAGFGNLSDIVSAAIPVFQNFGVTTTAQATQVLTDMMHAAEGAKESIPALTGQFSEFTTQLPGADKTLSNFNSLISAFAGEVQTVGSANAGQIFSVLAASSSNAAGPMEILGISFKDIQKSLLTDGGLAAITQTSKLLDQMGPGASLVAQGFGFSAQQVSSFQTNASKLSTVASNTQTIATNQQSINDAYGQTDKGINALLTDWNKVKASFLDNSFWQGVTGLATDFVTLLTKGVTGINSVLNTVGNDIASILPKSQSENQLNSLMTSALGFSPGSQTLNRLDQSANQSGLIDSLISALKTGASSTTYQQTRQTFNLSIPTGATSLSPKMIAQELYAQFQGTQ